MAMTIFSAGVLGVIAALSVTSRAASAARRLDEAVTLAQNHIELAKLSGGLRPAVGSSGTSGVYTWETQQDDRVDGSVLIRVSVAWIERGQPRAFQLTELYLPSEGEEAP
jgi:hypothetical protein